MSVKRMLALVVSLLAVLLAADPLQAQNYGSSPTVSPYLNLLNTDQFGNQVPGTYQTLVKPLIQGREAALANRSAINRLSRQVSAGAKRGGAGGAATGGTYGGNGYHSRYLNFGHYYGNGNTR